MRWKLLLKIHQQWSENAPRRVQNGSKIAPGGLPGPSPRAQPKVVTFFAPFLGLLGGPWAAPGGLWGRLGTSGAAPGALLGSILAFRGALFGAFFKPF